MHSLSRLNVTLMPCRWQRYVCSPAPLDAPYFTLLLVNKGAAPSAASSSFEEVHFDNSCMGMSHASCSSLLTPCNTPQHNKLSVLHSHRGMDFCNNCFLCSQDLLSLSVTAALLQPSSCCGLRVAPCQDLPKALGITAKPPVVCCAMVCRAQSEGGHHHSGAAQGAGGY